MIKKCIYLGLGIDQLTLGLGIFLATYYFPLLHNNKLHTVFFSETNTLKLEKCKGEQRLEWKKNQLYAAVLKLTERRTNFLFLTSLKTFYFPSPVPHKWISNGPSIKETTLATLTW